MKYICLSQNECTYVTTIFKSKRVVLRHFSSRFYCQISSKKTEVIIYKVLLNVYSISMGFVLKSCSYTFARVETRVFTSLPRFVSLGHDYTIALHFQYNTNSVPKSWKLDAVIYPVFPRLFWPVCVS